MEYGNMEIVKENELLQRFAYDIRIFIVGGAIAIATVLILGFFGAIVYNIKRRKKASSPELKTGKKTAGYIDIEINEINQTKNSGDPGDEENRSHITTEKEAKNDNEIAEEKADATKVSGKARFKSGVVRVMTENGKYIWLNGSDELEMDASKTDKTNKLTNARDKGDIFSTTDDKNCDTAGVGTTQDDIEN